MDPRRSGNRAGHQRFGNVRKRDSGRWQARYPGPDGRVRSAPQTFATKREAEQWPGWGTTTCGRR